MTFLGLGAALGALIALWFLLPLLMAPLLLGAALVSNWATHRTRTPHDHLTVAVHG